MMIQAAIKRWLILCVNLEVFLDKNNIYVSEL